jgi:hypothetical protein
LCHHFRRSQPDFFRELKHGPHTQPKKDAVRDLILGCASRTSPSMTSKAP